MAIRVREDIRTLTGPEKAAIDLVLLVESRDLSKATLNSLFASAIKAAAKKPTVLKEARAKLDALVQKYPQDHGVLCANALAAFAEGDAAQIKAAVEELFNVRVEKVRTQNRLGKHRRYRFRVGRLANWKKAIVTLHKEDRIEFF